MHHPLVGAAKDVAATAVLLSAVGAVAVACFLFLRKLRLRFGWPGQKANPLYRPKREQPAQIGTQLDLANPRISCAKTPRVFWFMGKTSVSGSPAARCLDVHGRKGES
jgi:hypothetical protein